MINRLINDFYKFMKESGAAYIVFGILTTIVAVLTYRICVILGLNPHNPFQLQIANIISWIFGVSFAYVTNRKWVFKSKSKKYLAEITKFFGARLVTLFLDMLIMFIGVNLLAINDMAVKLFSQASVIVVNYILSKLFVFREHKSEENLRGKEEVAD